jgi:hypothetical protein
LSATSAGHAPSPRARLLSWSCLSSQGLLRAAVMSRVWGSREASVPFGGSTCRNTRALRLRGVHTAAHPNALSAGEFPSQGWASFTVSPTSHRTVGSTQRCLSQSCSVRGLFPYSVLPVARSHLHPAGSQPAGYVAPSGFRTLSTPCSPRDLPGLFHPGSAPGVPLRGLSPRDAVRPFGRRTPRVFGAALASFASPSGIEHTTRILHAGPGFSRVTAPLPPWVFPLRGFLLPAGVDRATSPPPLSRFFGHVAC